MKNGRPSMTAYMVALSRAWHQVIDYPLVFEDPLALKIIGKKAAIKVSSAYEPSV